MNDEGPLERGASLAIADRFRALRRFTPARIALGRAGPGQPTEVNLRFAFDHARARDAVHAAADFVSIEQAWRAKGWEVARLDSAAPDRTTYLRRPDLGRRLSPESRARLAERNDSCDVAIVAADGLSALAVENGFAPLLDHLLPRLQGRRLVIGPLVLVEQGRVAVGDEIGELLRAKLVVVLIGERPGLSAADSLGAYITWAPRIGAMDSQRNCISNIRPGGLSFEDGAAQIVDIVRLAFAQEMTGVRLNDFRSAAAQASREARNTLTSGRRLEEPGHAGLSKDLD